jgi:hypothetical protein
LLRNTLTNKIVAESALNLQWLGTFFRFEGFVSWTINHLAS